MAKQRIKSYHWRNEREDEKENERNKRAKLIQNGILSPDEPIPDPDYKSPYGKLDKAIEKKIFENPKETKKKIDKYIREGKV